MENTISKLNSRKFRRLIKSMPVKLRVSDKLRTAEWGTEGYTTIAKDISEDGIFIEPIPEDFLYKFTPEQYRINLLINLPNYSVEVKATAEVIWKRKEPSGKGYGVGMRFIEVSDDGRDRLASYISETLRTEEMHLVPETAEKKIKEIDIGRRVALLSNTLELIKTVRILGLSHMLQMRKAKKLADKIQTGFFATRVINTLLNVGFFEEFSKREVVDIDSFAEERNFDRRILRILCDYLSILGIFKKDILGYHLDTKGKLLTEMLEGLFDILYSFEDIFHDLEPLLRKEKILGKDVAKRIYFEANGTGKAAKLLPFPIMIDVINKHNFKRVLDLGCGTATFLIELCKSNLKIKGYGVDISHEVLFYGQRQLIENSLQDRITLFEGNVLNDLEEAANRFNDVDIVTSSFVLHELFFE